MPQTCKTPAGQAGASRDHLGGWSHVLLNLDEHRAQTLIAASTALKGIPAASLIGGPA